MWGVVGGAKWAGGDTVLIIKAKIVLNSKLEHHSQIYNIVKDPVVTSNDVVSFYPFYPGLTRVLRPL